MSRSDLAGPAVAGKSTASFSLAKIPYFRPFEIAFEHPYIIHATDLPPNSALPGWTIL